MEHQPRPLRLAHLTDLHFGAEDPAVVAGLRADLAGQDVDRVLVSGDLTMETVSGEIILADSSAQRVAARTISGAITCDVDNPFASEIRLDTTSGEITARVPEDADLAVDLNATSGRIASSFPQVQLGGRPGMRNARGKLGAGTGHLYAHAISGNVSLLARPAEDLSGGPEEAKS